MTRLVKNRDSSDKSRSASPNVSSDRLDQSPVAAVTTSDRLLLILADRGSLQSDRDDAIQELLSLDAGWWGRGSLWRFTTSVARHEVRRCVGRINQERIDWESIANEALVRLWLSASNIAGSPRNWLWGLTSHLVRQRAMSIWPEITALPVTDWLIDEDYWIISFRLHGPLRDALRVAIQDLPPSLRHVARLLLVEQRPRELVCRDLKISSATLRKRFERLSKKLLSRRCSIAASVRSTLRPFDDWEKTGRSTHFLFADHEGHWDEDSVDHSIVEI